ncbi:EF-hand domain-containing protein [Luteimonas saliphila]|uniref:EF-hand domain-containing protein n=1 Tax=Luteimonas saliphila TaxID=2804919 RepID=UPI00192DA6D7|nr:EF-hand domain-containing protein [Luteimonas saliphila]
MRAHAIHRSLLATALVCAGATAAAQSTGLPLADPAPRPAPVPAPLEGSASPAPSSPAPETRIAVEPRVTLITRVADPAMVAASRAFDALDLDHDGVVDRGEAAAEAALADAFDAVDVDGNGRIDRDEYTARLRPATPPR